mmetsp:Transcript_66646/g.74664  ORF Transcript_66646/g.74664 Transcript_66646/m.74664 type:complete len:213 (+) Transcript_66646:159-797(+)
MIRSILLLVFLLSSLADSLFCQAFSSIHGTHKSQTALFAVRGFRKPYKERMEINEKKREAKRLAKESEARYQIDPRSVRPSYDTQNNLYIINPNDDGIYPYDPIGSLLRQGPAPFWTRLTNADEYEQGILKYMYNAKVNRNEATGNIDAKINNVLDWQYQKREEMKGAPKVDYTELSEKDAILVPVWAFCITPLVISILQKTFHLGTPLLPV